MKVHIMLGMNKLPISTRVQILSMLCEGSSMRSISRITGVSINTVTKLLEDAGEVCAAFHDEHVRGVKAKRVQVDEIWSFTYAKQKNVRERESRAGWRGRYVDLDRSRSRYQAHRLISSSAAVTANAPSGLWTTSRLASPIAFN